MYVPVISITCLRGLYLLKWKDMLNLDTQWTEWSYFYRHNFDNLNTAETAVVTSSYTMRLKTVTG